MNYVRITINLRTGTVQSKNVKAKWHNNLKSEITSVTFLLYACSSDQNQYVLVLLEINGHMTKVSLMHHDSYPEEPAKLHCCMLSTRLNASMKLILETRWS